MKTLFIECGMGAAGDMLTAALLELMPDREAAVSELNALGIPGIEYRTEPSVRCGVSGTHVSVLVHGEEAAPHDHKHDHDHDHDHDGSHHHHHHSDMHSISRIVDALSVSERVKRDVMAVYGLIAEAESAVHGAPVPEIHFHEVGTMDAVADVTAVCYLMEKLAPDEIIASPVHVGSGYVRCAHGLLPVPAPATAALLKGIPIVGGGIEGELCTPTGAALLRHFVSRFGEMPAMKTSAIGYGMGKKDFPRANCVRVFFGESVDKSDAVAVLSCNVDDMTAEEIGYAMERLFECGAREVYTVPIGMKKNRPGTLLRVICGTEDKERMAERIFRYTSTIGIRHIEMERYILDRSEKTLRTELGGVRIKSTAGYGAAREKIEYDDLARVARELDISLAEARDLIGKEFL